MRRRTSIPLAFLEADVRAAMDLWLPDLSSLVERTATGLDAAVVARTAQTFMVARTFSCRSDTARAEDFAPAVPLIARAVDGLTEDNLVERVEALMHDLGAVPGLVHRTRDGRPYEVLSAASKFVWTASPAVGIIVDARARACLALAHPIARRGDYGGFVRAVRAEMPLHAGFIDGMIPHAPAELRAAPWLRAKIFDFCLYAQAGRS